MDVRRQIAALSCPLFYKALILPAVPNSDVPFRATIADSPFRIGKIEYQHSPGDGSSHKTAIPPRTAFKNTEKSRAATAQLIDVKEIPVLRASCAVVQVHSGLFYSISIQIAVGYGIDADKWSVFPFIFVLTWRVEVVYASYGSKVFLREWVNRA